MPQKILILLFALVTSGCATTGTLNDIRFHTENIEISIKDNSNVLEWESRPDFNGDFQVTQRDGCKENKFYLFPSSFGDDLIRLTKNKVDLPPEPSPHKDILLKYTERLNQCDYFVAEKWTCRGNCFRTAPMDIVVIDMYGEIVHTVALTEREDIPLKYWPELAGAGVIDGFLGILAAPFVIVGAPIFWLVDTISSQRKSNKSMQHIKELPAD